MFEDGAEISGSTRWGMGVGVVILQCPAMSWLRWLKRRAFPVEQLVAEFLLTFMDEITLRARSSMTLFRRPSWPAWMSPSPKE
jgi:hypothetical protein